MEALDLDDPSDLLFSDLELDAIKWTFIQNSRISFKERD